MTYVDTASRRVPETDSRRLVSFQPLTIPTEGLSVAATPALPPTPPVSEHTGLLSLEVSRMEFTGLNPKLDGKLVVSPQMPPAAIEQYRKLAATLHHLQNERGVRIIMVSSAVPGEGKTLTAANLALTLSESYRRQVLLIDGDLRRPALYDVFQLPNVIGLSDALTAPAGGKVTAIQVSEHLAFLPAGRPDSDPISGLTSERMRRLVKDAAARFDWVIIDTPPVGLLPDANLLATSVDGALLVIQAGVTPYDWINRAVQALGRERIIGVVMNRTTESAAARDDSYYGYYR
jgi:capsular exopolysaccharide synthesis family protein